MHTNPSFLPQPLRLAVLVAFVCFGNWLLPQRLSAQATPNPPARMTYQGYLVDSAGVALGNSAPKNYDVIFNLYDAESGGTLLWAEQQTVTVDKGFFNVLLGEGAQVGTTSHADLSTLFKGATASDRYVGITVKGIGTGGANVDISPRLRLLSSPYSFLAQNAIKLVQTTGADLITSSGNAVTVAGPTTVNSTITATGTVTAPTVTSSGALNGATAAITGATSVGSLSSSGAVSGASATITGALSAGSISSSGTIAGTTITGSGTIPIGGIIIWYGATNAIPSGWALCNGQTKNNVTTPDLRDRFVLGAGNTYAVGNTGGSSSVTLSVNNLPAHTHGFTDAYYAENQSGGVNNLYGSNHGVDQDNSLYTRSATTDSTGGNQAFSVLPPYYVLAYIMRVQ